MKFLLILLLLNNCVILNIRKTEKLIKKEIVSQNEFETREQEFKFSNKKMIRPESISISFERNLKIKKNKDIIYNSHYLVTEELTDSFYIIGGIIPFVMEENGWDNYLKWAWILFPVSIVDWITVPFRTGTHEEKKTEKETTVLEETNTIQKDNSTLKVLIDKMEIPIQNNTLILPLSVFIDNTNVLTTNQYRKYEIQNRNLEYEIRDEYYKVESPNKVTLSLEKLLSQKEFDTILVYEAVNHPEKLQDVYPHFINRINNKEQEFQTIDKLINAGVKLNDSKDNDITPLSYACRLGNLDIVKYFVEKGADVNFVEKANNNYSPLHHSISTGNYIIAKFLIEKGSNVNSHGEANIYPLHLAINNASLEKKNLNFEMVQYLVEHGADVNSLDSMKETPLQRAKNKPEIAKYLVSKGAK